GEKEDRVCVEGENRIGGCPGREQALHGGPATRQSELCDHLPVRSDDGGQPTEPAPVDRDRIEVLPRGVSGHVVVEDVEADGGFGGEVEGVQEGEPSAA